MVRSRIVVVGPTKEAPASRRPLPRRLAAPPRAPRPHPPLPAAFPRLMINPRKAASPEARPGPKPPGQSAGTGAPAGQADLTRATPARPATPCSAEPQPHRHGLGQRSTRGTRNRLGSSQQIESITMSGCWGKKISLFVDCDVETGEGHKERERGTGTERESTRPGRRRNTNS